MKQSKFNLSDIETKFLLSLLEDGSKNDAEIAREIKVSKATTHRIRKKLKTDNILTDFIPIVNLDKLNIKFFAIVLFQWNKFDDEKLTNQMQDDLEKDPYVVYLSAGDSSDGLTHSMMLALPDLSAYHSYIQNFRKTHKNHVEGIKSFFIPSEKILKQDYTNLVREVLTKEQTQKKNHNQNEIQ